MMTSTPLLVPAIEVVAGTQEQVSPSRPRLDLDPTRLESRLPHSGSKHSLKVGNSFNFRLYCLYLYTCMYLQTIC